MVTSNCTARAPSRGVGLGRSVASGITLVERIAADSAEWVQTVRRVMGPTRWRKSTQVFIGLAVLAFVAAVVAAATFFTTGGHGAGGRARPVPPPRPPTVKPGMIPVRRHRRDTQPGRGGRRAGGRGGRSQPGPAGWPDHRRHHRERAVAGGRRPAVGAGVDQQGPDRRRGAADVGPSGPDQHPGGGRQPERPGARRAGGCR